MLEYLKRITDLAPYVGTAPICGLRVNTLKISPERFSALSPFELTPSPFYRYGYITNGDVDGRHPLHMSGAFYIQEPSAMSAITALNVGSEDTVLDMCASPGSKGTALGADCRLLVANEFVSARVPALIGNIERMGLANTLVTNSDSASIADAFEGCFDKVLVDSPCSGEGMFRKHPNILSEWTPDLVSMCAVRSAEILKNASRTVKRGGRLVYSTCTYNLEENEKVILDFLKNNPDYEVCDTGLTCGRSGLSGLSDARRIFISDGGEGHFVCALTRRGDVRRAYPKPMKLSRSFDFLDGITRIPPVFFNGDNHGVIEFSGIRYAVPADMPIPRGVRIMRAGVRLGEQVSKTFKPDHHLFMAVRPESLCNTVDLSEPDAVKYLHGQELACDNELHGWCGVMYEGLCMGGGKASGGMLKNHLPKGLRI